MSIWQEIKDSVSIVDIISDYLPVISKGQNHACKCPFHNDKNPSLMISEEKKIWHCFGCGAGGDIFAFVSEIEGISKGEALKKIASRSGISLPDNFRRETNFQKEEKVEILERHNLGSEYLSWASEFYHQILLKMLKETNYPITKYCRERGLDESIIKKFKLGYAPSGNFLLNYINRQNQRQKTSSSKSIDIFDIDMLKQVGLFKES